MTKADLIKAAAKKANATRTQTEEIINAALEAAADALAEGQDVKIQRFGTLEVRQRKPRTSHDFRTGEPILLQACKGLAFIPSDDLKRRVNQ